jgi:two-component system, chemotaxis family, sensor kinase Cph1
VYRLAKDSPIEGRRQRKGRMKRAERAFVGTHARIPGGQREQHPQPRTKEAVEAELRRLSARVAELEDERRQLERFTAMAAHELLKPLVMNEAYATSISERIGHAMDIESRRDLEAIVRISSRMRLLVEALLLDARETERPLRRQPVDLEHIVKDCLRMLESEIDSREARLDIDPMPVVEGDPAMLSGVFSNLLANALKYGPRRGSDIRVSAMRSEAGWTFGVESPGPGLPETSHERLFEAWQRGPGERRTHGAGLGLTIVRHIVERHGGNVGVDSGDSTNRFSFTLPD